MKFLNNIAFCLLSILYLQGQSPKIEPSNWWVGMQNPKLELLVNAANIQGREVRIDDPNVVLEKVIPTESPNFLILQLDIAKAEAGEFSIQFYKGNERPIEFNYPLKKRKDLDYEGFNSEDVIYLITPDRFVNGDPKNDIIPSLQEKTIDRKEPFARHGGDIRGIISSLDYISDMGFTALWSSPLLINDMAEQSYHGYAITDLYEVDPRFGTLKEYQELAEKCREKDIKLIMDMVANHIGVSHSWMQDRPFENWINVWPEYTQSNHRRTANQDRYASQKDKKELEKGWFVPTMPDLNQEDPYLATYLIQNNIWWIETLGLQGIRQDTYPYPNKEFMAKWCAAIMQEYPDFSIVGEEWSYNPLLIAYWQDGKDNWDGYRSFMKSSMDFAMQEKISEGLINDETWGTGLIEIYEGLANDFAYPRPKDIMIFPDNHDMNRIATQLNDDPILTQMAVGYQLMLPRIPQIYYGTEILMSNSGFDGNHGVIRTDFPGGWKGDKVNTFTGKGLSDAQKEMKKFMTKVLNYRKNNKTISKGQTTHFAPKDGVYVLFRWDGVRKVMVILNKNEESLDLDLSPFAEMNIAGNAFKNIITGDNQRYKTQIPLPKKGIYIFEVMAL